MKVNRYFAALLAASSVALALPAEAHRGGGHDGHGGGGMRLMRQLDLSAEQREHASKIFEAQRPALRERANAEREAHRALRQAVRDPSADPGRIRELADAAGRAHADAILLRAETMRRVFALLTPEQRQKLEQRQERRSRG